MRSHYIYIALCSDGSYYTGYTVDLQAREAKHNSGQGSKYTRSRLPLKFIYHEIFKDSFEAYKREYQIKRLTREKKRELIESCSNSL